MATQTQTSAAPVDHSVEKKIQQFRELFADAPELGKKALENALHELKSQASDLPPAVESAGRVGARLGKVSELTIIVPLAPGGAKRLRAFLRLLRGNLSQGADKVGTLHTMRFVFFDNDTRLLFATAYDGDWDTYIDDFVAKIPDYLDIIDSAWDGWPGIRSPGAKDYLVKHQITAEGWYVAYPSRCRWRVRQATAAHGCRAAGSRDGLNAHAHSGAHIRRLQRDRLVCRCGYAPSRQAAGDEGADRMSIRARDIDEWCHVHSQAPLGFAREADAVIVGSGVGARDLVQMPEVMGKLQLDPGRQIIGARCSGALLLANLGLLAGVPACTDSKTKPWVEEAGIEVLDQPLVAHGNVATAGGCLASQCLAAWAAWVIARMAGWEAAEKVVHYVAPIGHKQEYVERAYEVISPYLPALRSAAGGEHQPVKEKEGHHAR